MALRATYPRVFRQARRPVDFFSRIGDQVLFYGKALGGIPHAAVHFRKEIIRLIAEISMGAGTARNTIRSVMASMVHPPRPS